MNGRQPLTHKARNSNIHRANGTMKVANLQVYKRSDLKKKKEILLNIEVKR